MTIPMVRATWCRTWRATGWAFWSACVLLVVWPRASSAELPARSAEPPAVLLVVDADDDDDDGVADGDSPGLGAAALDQLQWFPRARLGRATPRPRSVFFRLRERHAQNLEEPRRDGNTDDRGRAPSGDGHVALQGLRPGRGVLATLEGPMAISVIELRAIDVDGESVDLARSHASLSRVLPAALQPPTQVAGPRDEDALRWLVIGPVTALPSELDVTSFAADGRVRDRGTPLPLRDVDCPPGTESGLVCRLSPSLRASTDRVDREHPAAGSRSVLAEVGGRLRVEVAPGVGQSIRVGGPRGAAGYDVGRYRAVVRAHVLRTAPGSPAVGADDVEAVALLRRELLGASALWGQCGIHFGPSEGLEIRVSDVPPAHLFAVGCGSGQRASGGLVRVEVAGQRLELRTRPGELPVEFASRLAEQVRALGFRARVSVNAAAQRSAERTADVLVREAAGGFVRLGTPDDDPASADPSLPVCLGEVDLADGLHHFNDFDAGAGTVEERALIKAFEDDDPATIELLVVPSFGGSGRIGESFIFGPGASLQNAVILDRAGIRSGGHSFALAHELGHVLLDMPGHPDDFGVDTPSSLMDADASDATTFGPRRLSVEECERALRQSGPDAPVPLLTPWPLFTPRSK